MRTYDEAFEAARDGSPFSNHTEWEVWSYNWCERCLNDSPELVDKGKGCPLIMVALMRRTPSEWLEQDGFSLGDQYHCVEFRDEDGPGDTEPKPIPDPPGQLTMWPREPFEGVRMLTQIPKDRVTA